MGVYKNITISFNNDSLSIDEVCQKIKEISDYNVEVSGDAISFDDLGNWYREEEDLKELSLFYKDTLFEVRHNESSEPMLDYYYNGKVESAEVTIVYSKPTIVPRTFEEVCETMYFNGYAYLNKNNFLEKNNEPCYIPENATSLEEVETYHTIIEQVLVAMRTEEFFIAMAEKYDYPNPLEFNFSSEEYFDYEVAYLQLWLGYPFKNMTEWAEYWVLDNVFDNSESWTFISTLLDEFTN